MRLDDGKLLIVATDHVPESAILTGLWLVLLKPLKVKKHGRLSKIFRVGFDFLRHILLDLHLNSASFS
jgi:hypothetical protein